MIKKNKLFFAWNMDKEKEWLEEQAKQGLILEKVNFLAYYFKKEEPKNIVYQFDFQMLSKEKEKDYLSLFEDWTFVTRSGGWYYFYKEKTNTDKDILYSNNTSKKSLYFRLFAFLIIVAFPIYYQLIFVFPRMESSRFEFPKFYFFARIAIIFFFFIHSYAVARIALLVRKHKKTLSE